VYNDRQFVELLTRVRGGDSDAATEIVRTYESAIRVAVRTRLSDPALRRQFDSMDVSQSVLASFFLRAAAGEYDLRDPPQLAALLMKMTHNKLAMRVRREYRQRRDIRRDVELSSHLPERRAAADQAVNRAVRREMIEQAMALMDAQEREMAECRAKGMEWSEIAVRIGGTPDARRKQFQRAVQRIATTLDFE